METREFNRNVVSGYVALAMVILTGLLWLVGLLADVKLASAPHHQGATIAWSIFLCFALAAWIGSLLGFFTLQPNEAAVLILFGKYVGTAKKSGFWWTNPFYMKKKVSLRRHNLNTPTIKVNDLRGNPIEIASVMVWQVKDTAQAVFDVEDYQNYVNVQAEAALRHLAMQHPYDVFADSDITSLRGSPEEVAKALQEELQERVSPAGVVIMEARLAHLAYATEIAGAMLQRQQADAIVAARARIVEGAVGMVEMAVERLTEHGKVTLDDERKASMATNLMVVLCGHEGAKPIINAGTLYH